MKKSLQILLLTLAFVPVGIEVNANIDRVCSSLGAGFAGFGPVGQCFSRWGCSESSNRLASGSCPVETARQCCNTGNACVDNVTTGPYRACEGAYDPWDKIAHTSTYRGQECRTITTTNTCGGVSAREDCRPCAYDVFDEEPPVCESVIDWTDRPLIVKVGTCTDDISGCDESSYVEPDFDKDDQPRIATVCDNSGRCSDCSEPPEDHTPPRCLATFDKSREWHRGEDFDANPPLRCWLAVCSDDPGEKLPDIDGPAPPGSPDDWVDQVGNQNDPVDPIDYVDSPNEVHSGCLPIGTLGDTPIVFDDRDGENPTVQVEYEDLDRADGDTCTIQVCDNAGWCNTCESRPLKFDDQPVIQPSTDQKRADGTPEANCEPSDDDCYCIMGVSDRCRENGPINCYTNPFHDRCPGFKNIACLLDPVSTPGCPMLNPCYPTRLNGAVCPIDAIRFCARNPYHYSCNLGGRDGTIDCSPGHPVGGIPSDVYDNGTGGGGGFGGL